VESAVAVAIAGSVVTRAVCRRRELDRQSRGQLREVQLCAADQRTAANGAVRGWLQVEVGGAPVRYRLKAYRFEGIRGPVA